MERPRNWQIGQDQAFKVAPQATWKRRTKRLSVDDSERTERLPCVLAQAEYVWGTIAIRRVNG